MKSTEICTHPCPKKNIEKTLCRTGFSLLCAGGWDRSGPSEVFKGTILHAGKIKSAQPAIGTFVIRSKTGETPGKITLDK